MKMSGTGQKRIGERGIIRCPCSLCREMRRAFLIADFSPSPLICALSQRYTSHHGRSLRLHDGTYLSAFRQFLAHSRQASQPIAYMRLIRIPQRITIFYRSFIDRGTRFFFSTRSGIWQSANVVISTAIFDSFDHDFGAKIAAISSFMLLQVSKLSLVALTFQELP